MAASLLLFCSLAIVMDDEVSLKELGFTLPKDIAGIAYQQRDDFDNKDLGYALSYDNRKCKITLIVYHLGNKTIPDGKNNELVAGQLKASIEDIKTFEKKGFWKNVTRIKALPLPKSV